MRRNLHPTLARLELPVMQEEIKERWLELCEQAASEQNSEKLVALVQEINRMLDEKEQRLKSHKPATAPFQRQN
jgi:hypothetical protein